MEMVAMDNFKSSLSVRGIWMPDFEVLDAKIASALNKIIHNSHFKRRVSLEEQKTQKEDRFLRGIHWRKSHLMTSWKDCTNWEYESVTSSSPYYSSKESWTWFSQIEDDGEKKYRARFTKQEFWGLEWKLWGERRGQESRDTTAWTKNSWRLLAMGNQRAVFKRKQSVTMLITSVQIITQPNPSPNCHAWGWKESVENPKSQKKSQW